METPKIAMILHDILAEISIETQVKLCDIKYSKENNDITLDFEDLLAEEVLKDLEVELKEINGVLATMFTTWANITKPRTSIVVIV